MTSSIGRIATSVRNSQTLRLLSVGSLVLLLQIPVAMIGRLISERQHPDTVRRAGLFTRRVILELPSDWSPAIQLFVFWLALVIWNREARAAAG